MAESTTATPEALPAALRRAPHLAQRRLGDEVVVMDLKEGRLYGFNAAGGELLDWLKPGRRIDALVPADAGFLDPALESFLALLVDRGLVAAADAADASGEPRRTAPEVGPPCLLWQEDAVRVTNQTSPPQLLTNPQCLP